MCTLLQGVARPFLMELIINLAGFLAYGYGQLTHLPSLKKASGIIECANHLQLRGQPRFCKIKRAKKTAIAHRVPY